LTRPGRARSAVAEPLSVVHSVQVWLPLTQTWLRNQVCYLPATVRSFVACERLEGPATPSSSGPAIASGVPRDVTDVAAIHPGLVQRLLARSADGARGRALAAVLRARKARLVHSHFGNTAWRDLRAVRRAGIVQVASFYGQDLTRFPKLSPSWRRKYGELLDSGAHILCEGPHMASVAKGFGGTGSTVHVHHLGIEVDRFRFHPRVRAEGEPLRVLMAASFREKKGLPDAIRALGLLAKDTAVEATLVGDAEPGRGPSQDEKARIEQAIMESGLGGRLRRTGFITHDALLREAYGHHVFLAPSRTASDGDTEGGAPVGLIEMAATGMAVVSTRHCDIPYVLPPSYAPLLASEGDVDGLHRALALAATGLTGGKAPSTKRKESAAASDGLQLDPLLRATRRRIESDYDVRVQGERLAALYHKVAA
jgi:colanic acid/amylovoran biosynthesis glycosyltransferase